MAKSNNIQHNDRMPKHTSEELNNNGAKTLMKKLLPIPKYHHYVLLFVLASILLILSIRSFQNRTKPSETSMLSPVSRQLKALNDMKERNLSEQAHMNHNDYLSTNSVILITGAAGFLGSELAMALHRTYNPKKIILIDSLEDYSTNTEDTDGDIERLEFKRQRIFNVIQTLGNVARFYKCDLRPVIPEFLEVGEIPVFDSILKQNADITHIVHLAGDRDPSKAVPRGIEDTKAGMMETILEQLKLLKGEASSLEVSINGESKDFQLPHFVYASTYEAYNNKDGALAEDDVIEAPMSFYGASKLLDEISANTYYNMYGIYSVGLRFFEVYGPWGSPQSDIAVIAEKMIDESENRKGPISQNFFDNIPSDNVSKDYIYIDDAIDAIMAAMQYRPLNPNKNNGDDAKKYPPPALFNVGSGESHSLHEISKIMAQFLQKDIILEGADNDTNSIPSFHAFTKKAESFIGFHSQYTLDIGIKKTLAWHRDRRVPYGKDNFSFLYKIETLPSPAKKLSMSDGILSCNPFDEECLKGAAAFACASECSQREMCLPSIYDQVIDQAKDLTRGCDAVLYTIVLDEDVDRIPSATMNSSPNSIPSITSTEENVHCNIAFVSENGLLYRDELHSQKKESTRQKRELKHGFWTLIPLSEIDLEHPTNVEYQLPKFSPQKFFSSTVQHAIYADPNVLFYNLPKLLAEMDEDRNDGETIMMTPSFPERLNFSLHNPNAGFSPKLRLQEKTYKMVNVAMKHQLRDGHMSTPWIIHKLQGERGDDVRLFRCDVLGELILWDVDQYDTALNFISGMHDFWARQMFESNEAVSPSRRLQSENDADSGKISSTLKGEDLDVGLRRLSTEEVYEWMGVISTTGTAKYIRVLLSDNMHVAYLE